MSARYFPHSPVTSGAGCAKFVPLGYWYTGMATFQPRGKSWRAIVRRKGFADQSKSFPTKGAAQTWAKRIEREQAQRTALGTTDKDYWTVKQCLEWYIEKQAKIVPWGRSKDSDLKRLKGYDIADRIARDLVMRDYVQHAERRRLGGTGPATVLNDIIWLRIILRAARASEGVPVALQEIEDAMADLMGRRIVAKSNRRERRLKKGEEPRLLEYFGKLGGDIPMDEIMLFALATARREDEITQIKWTDLNRDVGTAWLHDVKHPRKKIGNDKEFRVLADAWKIIDRQPKTCDRVFPYNSKTIGTYFTNACKILEIKNLHFHDLRHEATSRFFEMGYSIQEVAQFTLHESWATLKRYTHLKPEQVKERG